MQDNRVKAFRQRLVRAGFKDISIFERNDGKYAVYATDNDYVNYRQVMSIDQMESLPRLIWFDQQIRKDTTLCP